MSVQKPTTGSEFEQRNRILRTRDITEMLGVGRTTLWNWVRAGDFPTPLQLGPRTVGWKATDIQQWIDERPNAA